MVESHGRVKNTVRNLINVLGSFTISDLIRETGLKPASLRTEIYRLIKAGIIEVSETTSSQGRVGRPRVEYVVTAKAKEMLGDTTLVDDSLLSAEIRYEVAIAAQMMHRFDLDELERITRYDLVHIERATQELVVEGWIRRVEDANSASTVYEVISDLPGTANLPDSLKNIQQFLEQDPGLEPTSEYYHAAMELIREVELDLIEDQDSVLVKANTYLDRAARLDSISSDETSLRNASIFLAKMRLFCLQNNFKAAYQCHKKAAGILIEYNMEDEAIRAQLWLQRHFENEFNEKFREDSFHLFSELINVDKQSIPKEEENSEATKSAIITLDFKNRVSFYQSPDPEFFSFAKIKLGVTSILELSSFMGPRVTKWLLSLSNNLELAKRSVEYIEQFKLLGIHEIVMHLRSLLYLEQFVGIMITINDFNKLRESVEYSSIISQFLASELQPSASRLRILSGYLQRSSPSTSDRNRILANFVRQAKEDSAKVSRLMAATEKAIDFTSWNPPIRKQIIDVENILERAVLDIGEKYGQEMKALSQNIKYDQFSELPKAMSDPTWLTRGITLLLEPIIRYAIFNRFSDEFHIRTAWEDDHILIEVCNRTGLYSKDQQHLFFGLLSNNVDEKILELEYPDSAIELYEVKRIVSAIDGKFAARSGGIGPDGSTVSISIPAVIP